MSCLKLYCSSIQRMIIVSLDYVNMVSICIRFFHPCSDYRTLSLDVTNSKRTYGTASKQLSGIFLPIYQSTRRHMWRHQFPLKLWYLSTKFLSRNSCLVSDVRKVSLFDQLISLDGLKCRGNINNID